MRQDDLSGEFEGQVMRDQVDQIGEVKQRGRELDWRCTCSGVSSSSRDEILKRTV